MDVQTIDQAYQQLQSQGQQTAQELAALASKLQAAAQGGNQDAREWMLDLKSIALAFQAEQNQVNLLLQAIHQFAANQSAAMSAPPVPQSNPWGQAPMAPQPYPPAGYGQPQGGYGQQQGGYGQPQGGGGFLGGILNSGFGRAMEMGAGIGLGEDLINKIF